MAENVAVNPGAILATLMAGWAGHPVCIESHTTQITMAHVLKKSKVNQSIKALTLRCRVGNANAANAAMAGNDRSKARSLKPDSQVVMMATTVNPMGKDKCKLADVC
jgi:hypothetical protein